MTLNLQSTVGKNPDLMPYSVLSPSSLSFPQSSSFIRHRSFTSSRIPSLNGPSSSGILLAESLVHDANSTSPAGHLAEATKPLSAPQKLSRVDVTEKEDGFGSISEANHLLMSLLAENETELALKVFSNFRSDGIIPNSWTYSMMISCYCKRSEPIQAKAILDRMLEIGYRPNVATFTTLIDSFCKKGRLQKAYEVLGIMRRIGCEPTIQTHNCLLKGLCYVGRMEEAYEMLMRLKKASEKPDMYTYTAVMDGLCKVGRSDEAMELLDEAREMGLEPNAVSYNTLFNGYFKEGRPLDGIALLEKMKGRSCKPDYIIYSTLLHGLLKWGEVLVALRIYREMVRIGFKVDERMSNTLLRGLCRRSREDGPLLYDAYQVFDHMRSRSCLIYQSTYGLVIEAFCNGRKTEKAAMSLKEMVRAGCSPNTITFIKVIRVLCLEGEVMEALTIARIMCDEGRIAGRMPFGMLIHELNRKRMYLGARNVYGLALKIGVIPKSKPRS